MSDPKPSPVIQPLHDRVSKLRFKGYFDWEKLYKSMINWAKEQEYEFYERQYKHKWRGKWAELEIGWRLEREVNEFAKNVIYVFFHMWDYKEVDMVVEGKKKKMVYARMFIDFTGELQLDWQKRWDGSKMKRRWRDFYINYVIRHEIADVWWDKLWYHTNEFQQVCKKALGSEAMSDVYDDMW
ncbi:hypothetical protein HYS48_01135 [Candidatus Woesearchaeota archaeon]|nr:hypothetical protein [Candidatus Woesearchaeota archaeon]